MTTSAKATECFYGYGYFGRAAPGLGDSAYVHRPQHDYVGHRYAVGNYAHSIVQHRYVGSYHRVYF